MAENVKEHLEDLKNLSELMLDLAYSSVFFESKEIAKEVMVLYNELEDVEEKLYLHLFAGSRGKLQKKFISVLDVVESSKWVANAAKNMSETVLEGKALHPVIKEALKGTDESIVRVVVTKRSILKGKTLGDLRLRTEMGMHIIAIRRGNKWIFDPKKHTDILENDIMFAVGPSFSCKKLNKLAKGEAKKI